MSDAPPATEPEPGRVAHLLSRVRKLIDHGRHPAGTFRRARRPFRARDIAAILRGITRRLPRRRTALLALGCAFVGALVGAAVTLWIFGERPPGLNPLVAGDERLNVVRSPDGLMKTVQADQMIDAVLRRFVAETPAIAYARVAIVHGGEMSPQRMDLLHFSTIASVPAPGWPPMPMPQNHPLAEVRDYVLPVFAKPTCVLIKTVDLSDLATAKRILAAAVGVVIDCSIFSPQYRFLGMFYANFHSIEDLPADLSAIEARQRQAAASVGRALVAATP